MVGAMSRSAHFTDNYCARRVLITVVLFSSPLDQVYLYFTIISAVAWTQIKKPGGRGQFQVFTIIFIVQYLKVRFIYLYIIIVIHLTVLNCKLLL